MRGCDVCDFEESIAKGPPEREIAYWLGRAVWAVHRARQSMEEAGWKLQAAALSRLIRDIEETQALIKKMPVPLG